MGAWYLYNDGLNRVVKYLVRRDFDVFGGLFCQTVRETLTWTLDNRKRRIQTPHFKLSLSTVPCLSVDIK